MKNYNSQVTINIVCKAVGRIFNINSLCVSHVVANMILNLKFCTEDTDGVGDVANILEFVNLSIVENSESTLLGKHWHTSLDDIIQRSCKDAFSLLQNQVVTPILVW